MVDIFGQNNVLRDRLSQTESDLYCVTENAAALLPV